MLPAIDPMQFRRSNQHVAIAIDGPAASGKSSVAREVAEQFRFTFVNSGAMYRAFTWQVLKWGVDPEDSEAVVRLLNDTRFTCRAKNGASTIAVDDEDPGEAIHSDEVNAAVSAIAAIPEVRHRLVDEQRRYLDVTNVVMEGRDIGSVVFPETPYKFYLDASPEVRARRRGDQGQVDDIHRRDRLDSQRKTAPLTIAEGAYVIDTSHLSLEQVVEKIVSYLKAHGVKPVPEPAPPLERMTPLYRAGFLLFKSIALGLYGLRIINKEATRIPGGCLVAANHTSFMDPPLVGMAFREAIYFAARKTLFAHRFTGWLYPRWNAVPIDQESPDLSAIRTFIKLVRGGKKVLILPEGQRSFDGSILPAQRGTGMLIAKTRVPVIPVRIFGAHDIFPRHRKRPRLSGKITVVFGDPIHFSDEELKKGGKQAYQDLADRVMEAIAELKLPEA